MELADLKKQYELLAQKHTLPDFTEMNELFEIDRIDRETDTLIREVRKVMLEKIMSYIRFLEMMIHPASAPPMFLVFVKQITPEERKTMQAVYNACIELELAALKLEIEYDEQKEAALILATHTMWTAHTDNMHKIIGIMEKNWKGTAPKNGKSYFG